MNELSTEKIGAKIRGLRAERNMTQRELGEMADIYHDTLGKLERGETERVDVFILDKIAKAFGLTAEELLTRSRGSQ